jgi:hypothetical protein
MSGMPSLPNFRWIEVVATGALSATIVLVCALSINRGVHSEDLLAVTGGVGGAAVGAWLAIGGAIRTERVKRDEERILRRAIIRDALIALRTPIQKLADAAEHESDGSCFVLAHVAHDQVKAAMADFEAVGQSAPIDDFKLYRKLRSLREAAAIYQRFLSEVLDAAGKAEGAGSALVMTELRSRAKMFGNGLKIQVDDLVEALAT